MCRCREMIVVVCLIEVLVEEDKVVFVVNEVDLVSRVMKIDPMSMMLLVCELLVLLWILPVKCFFSDGSNRNEYYLQSTEDSLLLFYISLCRSVLDYFNHGNYFNLMCLRPMSESWSLSAKVYHYHVSISCFD
jgi:hypothetical protein